MVAVISEEVKAYLEKESVEDDVFNNKQELVKKKRQTLA